MTTTSTNPRTATRWVVALTGLGSLMAALDTLVVATALSTIRVDLGASVEQLEWTVNAYNLSFAVLLITGAALGDRYGRRNLYARAAGQLAFGHYAWDAATDRFLPHAVTVIALDGEAIADITAFLDPELVLMLGLPAQLD